MPLSVQCAAFGLSGKSGLQSALAGDTLYNYSPGRLRSVRRSDVPGQVSFDSNSDRSTVYVGGQSCGVQRVQRMTLIF